MTFVRFHNAVLGICLLAPFVSVCWNQEFISFILLAVTCLGLSYSMSLLNDTAVSIQYLVQYLYSIYTVSIRYLYN